MGPNGSPERSIPPLVINGLPGRSAPSLPINGFTNRPPFPGSGRRLEAPSRPPPPQVNQRNLIKIFRNSINLSTVVKVQ